MVHLSWWEQKVVIVIKLIWVMKDDWASWEKAYYQQCNLTENVILLCCAIKKMFSIERRLFMLRTTLHVSKQSLWIKLKVWRLLRRIRVKILKWFQSSIWRIFFMNFTWSKDYSKSHRNRIFLDWGLYVQVGVLTRNIEGEGFVALTILHLFFTSHLFYFCFGK